MVIPTTVEEIINVLRYCHQRDLPLFVFGLGSNILVRDKGIRGMVMKLGEGLKRYAFRGNRYMLKPG